MPAPGPPSSPEPPGDTQPRPHLGFRLSPEQRARHTRLDRDPELGDSERLKCECLKRPPAGPGDPRVTLCSRCVYVLWVFLDAGPLVGLLNDSHLPFTEGPQTPPVLEKEPLTRH